MNLSPVIRSLSADEIRERIDGLSAILVDCVAGGASVGFMAPLGSDRAQAYWRGIALSVAAGERILIAADIDGEAQPAGTVQIVLDQPENQPHRGDLAKLLVHRRARNRGLGRALVETAENMARAAGKTLLVLDTAGSDAERLYRRLGWIFAGHVPGYALLPDGRPWGTSIFYKELAAQ
ncbi:GNAT family N-acetyltransferase [Sphingomonas oleivorans]|uniref:GNAT family N-acetyltransferase n=1 Tax=Sphingomonas oleivorans TaxID=1735121 RepID=UPI001A9D5414|nr:GNAT family N-acetyltransferase [Sphingomonas oleivorans]